MPVTRIYIYNQFDSAYKKQLTEVINKTVVQALQVQEKDGKVLLFELDKDNFLAAGKSNSYTMIEVLLFAGRSAETKKRLYQLICHELEQQLHIPKEEVFIILNEQPLENWGIRGGKAANEVSLDFKVNI